MSLDSLSAHLPSHYSKWLSGLSSETTCCPEESWGCGHSALENLEKGPLTQLRVICILPKDGVVQREAQQVQGPERRGRIHDLFQEWRTVNGLVCIAERREGERREERYRRKMEEVKTVGKLAPVFGILLIRNENGREVLVLSGLLLP